MQFCFNPLPSAWGFQFQRGWREVCLTECLFWSIKSDSSAHGWRVFVWTEEQLITWNSSEQVISMRWTKVYVAFFILLKKLRRLKFFLLHVVIVCCVLEETCNHKNMLSILCPCTEECCMPLDLRGYGGFAGQLIWFDKQFSCYR